MELYSVEIHLYTTYDYINTFTYNSDTFIYISLKYVFSPVNKHVQHRHTLIQNPHTSSQKNVQSYYFKRISNTVPISQS